MRALLFYLIYARVSPAFAQYSYIRTRFFRCHTPSVHGDNIEYTPTKYIASLPGSRKETLYAHLLRTLAGALSWKLHF